MIDKIIVFIKKHRKMCVFALLTFYIVVSFSVNTFASDDTSLVEYTNSDSYKGCPAYPYTDVVPYVDWYCKSLGHILLYSESTDTFKIIYILGNDGAFPFVVKSGDNYVLRASGTNKWYNDSSCTVVHDTVAKVSYMVFESSSNGSWKDVGGGFLSPDSQWDCYNLSGNIVQSSLNVYADKNKTSVFIRPERVPSMLGLTPAQMTAGMMTEILYLIPLVIGLVIFLMAFWKAYRMLRRALLTA